MSGSLSFLAAVGFMAIHLFSKYLSLDHLPLRRFLSFAGGVSVAYVFMHLLPAVSRGQQHVAEQIGIDSGFSRYFVYLIALLGFALFYAMEHFAIKTWSEGDDPDSPRVQSRLFWFHIAFFVAYNMMIGYLVASDPYQSGLRMLLYFIALGLHFFTNDWNLRRHHKEDYDRYGRYLLAGGILAGWLIGALSQYPEVVLVIVEAFISGAIVLNAIKEELPSGKNSNLTVFLSGLVVTAFLFVFL